MQNTNKQKICNGYNLNNRLQKNFFLEKSPRKTDSPYPNDNTNPLRMIKKETPQSPPKSKVPIFPIVVWDKNMNIIKIKRNDCSDFIISIIL